MSSQPDHDSYRVMVLTHDALELLTLPNGGKLTLPSIEVPRSERTAEYLTHALNRQLGCKAICLFSSIDLHPTKRTKSVLWQVLQCHEHRAMRTPPAAWVRVSSLAPDSFRDVRDYFVVQQSLEKLRRTRPKDSQPFCQLGWFEELQAWVKQVIQPLGIELTGEFSQLNACPSFSLIRFETTGAPVWFKAVGEPNEHEFPITIALSQRFPRYLPTLLAERWSWRGWLTKDGGRPLAQTTPTIDVWMQAATGLASLQIEAITHSQQLLSAGSRDLRIPRLLALVEPFLDRTNALMQRQSKASPPPLSCDELSALGATIQDALAALEETGFPATLGHSDFNPGNILWTGSGSRMIDWAEAYIGHPFLTYEYFVSHLRRDFPEIAPFENFIRTSFTQPWKYVMPVQSIDEALIYTPLIAVFAYAVSLNSWQSPEPQDPQRLAYVRSLARRMKREADLLDRGRVPCLQC